MVFSSMSWEGLLVVEVKRVYMMLIRADFSTPETVKVTGEIDYVKMLHFWFTWNQIWTSVLVRSRSWLDAFVPLFPPEIKITRLCQVFLSSSGVLLKHGVISYFYVLTSWFSAAPSFGSKIAKRCCYEKGDSIFRNYLFRSWLRRETCE